MGSFSARFREVGHDRGWHQCSPCGPGIQNTAKGVVAVAWHRRSGVFCLPIEPYPSSENLELGFGPEDELGLVVGYEQVELGGVTDNLGPGALVGQIRLGLMILNRSS